MSNVNRVADAGDRRFERRVYHTVGRLAVGRQDPIDFFGRVGDRLQVDDGGQRARLVELGEFGVDTGSGYARWGSPATPGSARG